MLKPMTPSASTPQQPLTPEERRELLRAFADRMLIKATAMDDPEDMPGIERAVRVMAVIERVYSRCDRAEAHAPDPRKLEADRARNTAAAIQSRVALAGTLEWGEKRRRDLGPWWDAAETTSDTQTQVLATAPGLPKTPRPQAAARQVASCPTPEAPAATVSTRLAHPLLASCGPAVRYADDAQAIDRLHAAFGLEDEAEPDDPEYEDDDWPGARGSGPPSG